MTRVRQLALAALLALAPIAAVAQSTAPAPVASNPTVSPPPGAEVTPPPTPERPTADPQTEAERATTPRPALAPDASLAPVPPAEATGLGSGSPALPAANAPGAFPRVVPTPGIGQPSDRSLALQEVVTPIGVDGRFMNDVVLVPLMALVTLIVFGLLGYAIFKFRRRDGVAPAKWSHNTTVEVVWTLVPVLILLGIAVPSFQLLAAQYDPPKADLTIKAIGHQWYWEYEYPDQGGFSFDAVMLSEAESAEQGSPRLLDTDNRVVVPVGATVKVLVTAADVMHAWAVPAFWVKQDAVPGRINETWFKAERAGVYFGQCSELCGTKHGFMPIAVEVLPRARFDAWVAAKQAENGITPGSTAAVVAPAAAPVAAPGAAASVPDAPAQAVRPVEPAASAGPGASSGRNAGTNADTQ